MRYSEQQHKRGMKALYDIWYGTAIVVSLWAVCVGIGLLVAYAPLTTLGVAAVIVVIVAHIVAYVQGRKGAW